MRLLLVIFCLLSASFCYAAGISSKTADHVLYKSMAGTTTIRIPDWELIVDNDSLAGKKSLPVPKSNKTFDVILGLPRPQLVKNLAKLAKIHPYIFLAEALIDLYYDENSKTFKSKSSLNLYPDLTAYIESKVKLVYGSQNYVESIYCYVFCWNGVGVSVLPLNRNVNFTVSDGIVTLGRTSVGVYTDLPRYFNYNGLRVTSPERSFWYNINQSNGYVDATDTQIEQSIDISLDAGKLRRLPQILQSQGWTLETDNIPAVTGPNEVVVSTQTKTITNPDGTTTTQKILEKFVYTYNQNVITENKVIQVFEGNQIVETNITEVNETSNQPVDYTFQSPDGQYPTDVETPKKRNLVAEVLNPVASQLESYGSKIGLRGSGQCAYDVPFNLGVTIGVGRLDFCRYESTFTTLGSIFVSFAYLLAGLIVLGMRH